MIRIQLTGRDPAYCAAWCRAVSGLRGDWDVSVRIGDLPDFTEKETGKRDKERMEKNEKKKERPEPAMGKGELIRFFEGFSPEELKGIPDGDPVFFLEEERSPEGRDDTAPAPDSPLGLYKYGSTQEMIRTVLMVRAARKAEKKGEADGNDPLMSQALETGKFFWETPRIVAVTGERGGVGVTSVALGLAGELARFHGRKTLYLSWESFPSVTCPEGKKGKLETYLYFQEKNPETDPEGFLEKNDAGVLLFPVGKGINPLKELLPDEIPAFLYRLSAQNPPDDMIIDCGSGMSEAIRAILARSFRILCVYDRTPPEGLTACLERMQSEGGGFGGPDRGKILLVRNCVSGPADREEEAAEDCFLIDHQRFSGPEGMPGGADLGHCLGLNLADLAEAVLYGR